MNKGCHHLTVAGWRGPTPSRLVSKRALLFEKDWTCIPLIAQNPSICDPVMCVNEEDRMPAISDAWPGDPHSIFGALSVGAIDAQATLSVLTPQRLKLAAFPALMPDEDELSGVMGSASLVRPVVEGRLGLISAPFTPKLLALSAIVFVGLSWWSGYLAPGRISELIGILSGS